MVATANVFRFAFESRHRGVKLCVRLGPNSGHESRCRNVCKVPIADMGANSIASDFGMEQTYQTRPIAS